ncbi:MAG: FlgD immunoglobulin-like domain containing protein [bacterium]
MSPTSATLRTFVYEVSRTDGSYYGWYPTTPGNVAFAYTVMGTPGTPPSPPPAPTNLTITNAGNLGENPNLSWNASSGATSYNIYRCVTNSIQTCSWALIDATTNTNYTDIMIVIRSSGQSEDTFHWEVTAVNSNGESARSNKVSTIGEQILFKQASGRRLPEKFTLFQNYPNPFNPTTEIRYALPDNSQVTLSIFNLVGQKVRTLVDETQSPGYYSIFWDGKDEFAKDVASGIYVYRIIVVPNTFGRVPIQTERKMTLLR